MKVATGKSALRMSTSIHTPFSDVITRIISGLRYGANLRFVELCNGDMGGENGDAATKLKLV